MSTSTSESPSGSEDLNTETSLNMPTEIFFVLFDWFAPKDIVRCRQVCTRWRDIIDIILHNDTKWKQFCKHDFPKIYEGAMWKTPDIMTWFEMYRTLSLWSSIDKAQETVDEFCHSETMDDEMKGVTIQKRGLIMVHKRSSVMFYDLLSLRVAERKGFSGRFMNVVELEDIVVMLGINGDLRIINKPHQNWHSDLLIVRHQGEMVFHEVKSFIIENRTVFFVNIFSQIYAFHLDNKTTTLINLQENMEVWPASFILGYKNGCLYILSMTRELYSYDYSSINLKYKLDKSSNVMNCLYQHNMLDKLDWRYYYVLRSNLHQKNHTGHLQFISKMHVYGDELFFVGTQSGMLNVYYKPFVDGELNLMQFPPVKSYNFSARVDIPILSVYPIINIQVVETKEGHIILVSMPRKIQVITYSNVFKIPKSTAIIPYVPHEVNVI